VTRLIVEDIHTFYGTSHILFGVSIDISPGESVCLLGRNGVGKTTTLKTIIGLAQTKTGSVQYGDTDLANLRPDQIARLGIGYVPDERIIFPDLTVRENLEIGAKTGLTETRKPWSVEGIFELFPKLQILENNLGGYLSGGEQQMLTIGRTLMGNPDLLLLDEPVEGLAPVVVDELMRQVKMLKESGLAILFAEQNIRFATEISDRAYVLEGGQIRYHGTMQELHDRSDVKEKYLML